MDQGRYQILKQYVGTDLLEYVINYSKKIRQDDQFNDLTLNTQQHETLEKFEQLINQARHLFVANHGFGNDIRLMIAVSGINIREQFKLMRLSCGGVISAPNVNNDHIKEMLLISCINEYPLLLLNPVDETFNRRSPLGRDHQASANFAKLIEQDVILKLTNQKKDYELSFELNTDVGIQVKNQLVFLLDRLIDQAFYNCCSRMSYDLQSVLEEASNLLDGLRSLANIGSLNFSSFVGLKGLIFDGFQEIDLGAIKFRQISAHMNPSSLVRTTYSQHHDGSRIHNSGVIAEIKHQAKRIPLRDSPGSYSDSTIADQQTALVERFLMAIVLHRKNDRGISLGERDYGFPLMQTYGFAPANIGYEIIVLSTADLESIKKWFAILSKPEAENVSVAIRRLLLCVYERSRPEDAIIDAFIAWEAMFTASSETTFRVTGSLAKLLFNPLERKTELKRLKKLYSLRSSFVHGSGIKLSVEELSTKRVEVFSIAVEALRKLLEDKELLEMTASDRTEALLITKE